MDPYIEAPEVWSDFHGALAAEIRTHLNKQIQPRYVARMTPRTTHEIVEIADKRGVVPDVGVWRQTQVIRETTTTAIDYQAPPPPPPLSENEMQFVDALLKPIREKIQHVTTD